MIWRPLESTTFLLLMLIVAVLAGGAGYCIRDATAPVAERVDYRPLVRQRDGSVIAERSADAKPPPPPHIIPAGHVEERRISAVVAPSLPGPVQLDLSLVRDDEGGRRAIVSSPDGEIVSALDMPLMPALVPAPERPWAAGIAWSPNTDRAAVWVERDLGRIRLGADVWHTDEGALVPSLRAGWRF